MYTGLSIDAHLRMGAALNSTWDDRLANRRIQDLGLDPSQRAGRLSGGQRAQLALTLAIAKRPSLLLLDEPVASLDPLARREFLAILMEVVAEHHISVILSSHLVADLERVCDYLVVLAASRVQVGGDIDELLSTHHRLVGTPRDLDNLPDTVHVIESSSTDRQTTVTVRSVDPIMDPAWSVESLTMEDLVLAYMGQAEEQRRGLVRAKQRAMIRFAWRQFRFQLLVVAVLLIAVADRLSRHGTEHRARVRGVERLQGQRRLQLPGQRNSKRERPDRQLRQRARPGLPGAARHLLGRAANRPRTRDGNVSARVVPRRDQVEVDYHKIAVVGLASMIAAGLMSWMFTWWASPIDTLNANRFGTQVFDTHYIVPIGYAAFAFAVGVTAGVLWRRTLPAMATTLVIYVAARITFARNSVRTS